MKLDSKSSLQLAATLMNASTPSSSSSSSSSSSNPSSSSSVLSRVSSHSSSSLSNLSPSKTLLEAHVCATKPSFSLVRKRKSTTCKWVSRLFRLHKLPMEADEGLLLHRPCEGLHESWGDADDRKVDEKPKRELRFAAKIAAAMDADGFMGVKDTVCAVDTPLGMKQSVCVKNVGTLYCGQRPPLKQARPRRRWRLFRRLRRTRVLFTCMLQKVRKALTTSSKRTLQVRDEFIK